MDEATLRERIWGDLEASGEARFPFPPHGRIPNLAGASEAAGRLAETEAWQAATTVKANPDAPQLPVRRTALRAGKTLYVAVPRLRDERCFRRLVPDVDDGEGRPPSGSRPQADDYDAATTVSGIDEYGDPVAGRPRRADGPGRDAGAGRTNGCVGAGEAVGSPVGGTGRTRRGDARVTTAAVRVIRRSVRNVPGAT